MKKKIYALCMLTAVVSFLGFAVENVFMVITCGCIDNRSMYLPFLLGYGLAVTAIYLLLGTPRSPRVCKKELQIANPWMRIGLYFLEMLILVCLGEIVLGTIVEETCGFEWWNYSSYPLHITKYTSIPTSSLFAGLITVFMHSFFEPIMSFFERWDTRVLGVTGILLVVLMVADFLISAKEMHETGWLLIRWRIIFDEARFYGSF